MASTTVRSRPGADRVTAPTKDDGTAYRYEMVHDGDALRSYADEPAELMAALVPGYADDDDPVVRARARIAHAIRTQVGVQAHINVHLGTEHCTDEERAVLGGDRASRPAPSRWAAPVPLVLVDCFYEPVTDVPKPAAVAPGEILWLRTADDWEYLCSLAGLGVVMLAERA